MRKQGDRRTPTAAGFVCGAAARTQLAALVLLFVTSGCGLSPAEATEEHTLPPLVISQEVRRLVSTTVARRGVVEPRARLALGFPVAGVISELRVDVGREVRANEVLARLVDSDARATFSAAQAELRRAQQELSVSRTLVSAGALSSQDRKRLQSGAAVARANVAHARTGVDLRVLRSPVTGTVHERYMDVGEAVGAGTPVVVVDDTSELIVRVGLSADERALIQQAREITLSDGETGPMVKAHVLSTAKSPSADGLFSVQLGFSSRREAVWAPGSLLTVHFDVPPRHPFRVPLEALVQRLEKNWLFVVEGQGSEAKVSMREVQVGAYSGSSVAIVGGIEAGERIVSEGGHFLRDGEVVRLQR